jgi:putative effector of murein hydrolase LrgA (UPF0299 family)
MRLHKHGVCSYQLSPFLSLLIAIIVGSIVAAILTIGVIACLMSWVYQFSERSRMKRKPKTDIFQDQ